MTKEKALEIVKAILATKNKKNEIIVDDMLQFQIASTILSKHYNPKELKKLLNKE
jgi:hypothetical protein